MEAPLSVVIPLEKYVAVENSTQMEIPCKVSPKRFQSPVSGAKVQWLFKDSEIDFNIGAHKVRLIGIAKNLWSKYNFISLSQKVDTNLVIQDVSIDKAGNYTCYVTTPSERKNASTYLEILFAPRLLQPTYEGRWFPQKKRFGRI